MTVHVKSQLLETFTQIYNEWSENSSPAEEDSYYLLHPLDCVLSEELQGEIAPENVDEFFSQIFSRTNGRPIIGFGYHDAGGRPSSRILVPLHRHDYRDDIVVGIQLAVSYDGLGFEITGKPQVRSMYICRMSSVTLIH